MTFDATRLKTIGSVSQDEPRFLPTLHQADVVVPAMSALAGARQVVGFKYPEAYKQQGFTGNVGKVFFEVASGTTPLEFAGQSDRSGGFVTPSLNVTGLSRLTGPIGGDIADAISAGQFKPDKFFAGIGAKLFGVVELSKLLKQLPFDPANVPTFVGQALDLATTLAENARRLLQAVDQVEATIGNSATQLKTELSTFVADFAAITAKPSGAVDEAKITADLNSIAGKLHS